LGEGDIDNTISGKIRLDIYYWRPIDGIEPLNLDYIPSALQQSNYTHPYWIRSIRGASSKQPYQREILPPSRVNLGGYTSLQGDFMHPEDYNDVEKLL